MDDRDGEVTKCNKALVPVVAQSELLFLAKQGNLRDRSFYRDNKHIKSEKIGRYVSNIKSVLREAYGIEDPRRMNQSAKNHRNSPEFSRRKEDKHIVQNNIPGHYEKQSRGDPDEDMMRNLRRLFSLLK